MRLARLRPAYDGSGPFATVYLEPTVPDANTAESVQLRWEAQAAHLREAGAEADDVAAIAELVASQRAGRLAASGLIAVATDGRITYHDGLRAPVGGDSSSWAALPEFGPYVRAGGDEAVELVVVVDRAGADLIVRDDDGREEDSVDGQQHPLHKVRGGGWAHQRLQNTVEEVADRNAAMVAEELARWAKRTKPAVIALAGDVEARARVLAHVPTTVRSLVHEVGGGHRGTDAYDDIADKVAAVVTQWREAAQDELLDRFREALGTGAAVEGLPAVAGAARQGALETLILVTDNPDAGTAPEVARTQAAIGSDPTQVATTDEQFGLLYPEADLRHVNAADALIRAGTATDAHAVAVGPDAKLADDVAALLRFAVPE